MFVKEVSDCTETTVHFKDQKAWDKEGTYDVQIAAVGYFRKRNGENSKTDP